VVQCFTKSCTLSFFFFQAEDGIRDRTVTGVQTCALPIFVHQLEAIDVGEQDRQGEVVPPRAVQLLLELLGERAAVQTAGERVRRSEERRVGKECRSRWSQEH